MTVKHAKNLPFCRPAKSGEAYLCMIGLLLRSCYMTSHVFMGFVEAADLAVGLGVATEADQAADQAAGLAVDRPADQADDHPSRACGD